MLNNREVADREDIHPAAIKCVRFKYVPPRSRVNPSLPLTQREIDQHYYYLFSDLEDASAELWSLQDEDDVREDDRKQASLRRGTKSRGGLVKVDVDFEAEKSIEVEA